MALHNANPSNVFSSDKPTQSDPSVTYGDMQEAIYTVIKSTPALLELMFQDMFAIARVHLGLSKRNNFQTLTAMHYTASQGTQDWAQDNIKEAIENGGLVITSMGKVNRKATLNMFIESPFNWPIACKAIAEINRIDGTHYSRYLCSSNHLPIIAAFFGEYWDDMVTYATHNYHYSRNWQSFSLTNAA